jgi:hypothetical protein
VFQAITSNLLGFQPMVRNERFLGMSEVNRRFTRKNQRHACGTGERDDVLQGRPAKVVELYEALDAS